MARKPYALVEILINPPPPPPRHTLEKCQLLDFLLIMCNSEMVVNIAKNELYDVDGVDTTSISRDSVGATI